MADHDTHDDHGHDDGLGKYWVVFGALVFLTVTSFAFGSWIPMPEGVTRVVMMAISCAKALLVMLFFMHLLWEANWKYVLTIPASIMSMLLVLALVPDVGMRGKYYAEERTRFASDASPEHAEEHPDEHEGEGGAGEGEGENAGEPKPAEPEG